MTDKNEVMELAKKCGAVQVYPGEDVAYTFSFAQLISFAAALEEKRQAQIAEAADQVEYLDSENDSLRKTIVMLRNGLEKLACLGNGNTHGNSIGNCMAVELLNATQQSSEAFPAEVRAALATHAEWCNKQATSDWYGRSAASMAMTHAEELRNSAAQPEVEQCPNCDADLPEGCGGHFKDEGRHCWLNRAQPEGKEGGE